MMHVQVGQNSEDRPGIRPEENDLTSNRMLSFCEACGPGLGRGEEPSQLWA